MPKLDGKTELALSDGRKAVLRVDFEAMALAEEAADKPLAEILGDLQAGTARLRTQRALFFGMLKQDMPELTIEAAGDLLISEAAAFEAGMKALSGSMPADDGEAGDDAEPDPPTASAEATSP